LPRATAWHTLADRGSHGALAPVTRPPSGSQRGLRFALLASPAVQLVRFGTKAGLTWLMTPEVYGPAALAGQVAYFLSHIALLGLSESVVQATQLDAGSWHRLRALHVRSGAVVGLLMAAGAAVYAWLAPADAGTALLIAALAPMVFVANLATLPTALLVREQAYGALFRIDVVAALALAAVTLGMGLLGAGAWSVLGGLYANALVAALMASAATRTSRPTASTGDGYPALTAKGRRFCKADVLMVSGDLGDGLGVGFLLGQFAMGLYSQASNVAQMLLNYTTSLAERSLFPFLAHRQRHDALGPAYAESLRVGLLYLVPAHAVLALAAEPLTALIFDPAWAGIADLLALLALASGARCVDIVATTALKARGDAARVERLGWWRLGLLLPAVLSGLPFGVLAMSAGVLVARVAAAGASLAAARPLLPETLPPGLAGGCRSLLGWGVLCPLGGVLLLETTQLPPLASLALLGLWSIASWLLLRQVVDRVAFQGEWRALAQRWSRPSR